MKRQKRLWTAAAACAVLGAACRAVPGVRFAGLLFWCLTALLIVFAMLEQYKEHAWAKWGKRVLLALVCLGLVAFGYLESLVIRGAHTDGRAEDAQCVVILGAGVNGTTPSLMLSSRLQAALDLKPGIAVGSSWLVTLVLGLVKFLVWRSRISKRPKPAMVTLSPAFSTSPMVPKMPSMIFSTSTAEMPVSFATLVINCDLVITRYLPKHIFHHQASNCPTF